jgi:hypothetical protein
MPFLAFSLKIIKEAQISFSENFFPFESVTSIQKIIEKVGAKCIFKNLCVILYRVCKEYSSIKIQRSYFQKLEEKVNPTTSPFLSIDAPDLETLLPYLRAIEPLFINSLFISF